MGMLVLGVKDGDEVLIGRDIVVKFKKSSRGDDRLGIDAPREIPIVRQKLVDQAAGSDAGDGSS